jgi:hypothetical protein
MTDTALAPSHAAPSHRPGAHHLETRLPSLELAGIAGLGAIIAIHAADLAGKVSEVAYLGFGFLALIVTSFVAIVMLAVGDRRRGWALAGLTAGATFLGYVVTRATGFPSSHDDLGNWGETLGVWSLLVEGAVVLLSAAGLRARRRAA